MHDGVAELLAAQSGVVTYQQLLSVVSRRMLQELVECGALQRVWRGCIAGRFRIVDCGYAVWICWSVGWSCRAWARLRNCTDSTQSDRTRSTFCSQNIPGCVINAAYACIGAPERRPH